MSSTKQKAIAILNEKETKLLPQNIKKGVTVFGITGTHSGGSSATTIEELLYNIDNTKQVNISYDSTTIPDYLERFNEYVDSDTSYSRKREILSNGYLPTLDWHLYNYDRNPDTHEQYITFGIFAAGPTYLNNNDQITWMLSDGGLENANKYVSQNVFAYISNSPDSSDISYQEIIMMVSDEAKGAFDTCAENHPDITIDDKDFGCEGWYKVRIEHKFDIDKREDYTIISFSSDLTLSINCDLSLSPFEYSAYSNTGVALSARSDENNNFQGQGRDISSLEIAYDVPDTLPPLTGLRQFISTIEDVMFNYIGIEITPFESEITEYNASFGLAPSALPTGFTHVTLVKSVDVQGEVSYEELVEPIQIDSPTKIMPVTPDDPEEFYLYFWSLPISQDPKNTFVAWKNLDGDITLQPYDWYEYYIEDIMTVDLVPQQEQK